MPDAKASQASRARRVLTVVLANALGVVGLLFLIEGCLSYVEVGGRALPHGAAERVHSEYDEELGWINLPSVRIVDMYGEDENLTTNARRFRNRQEFDRRIPEGRTRALCLGDSFTLGFGVDDAHTWCQQLDDLDARLETANLGQGGYGVDQAYLWYLRNQVELDHDFHLFAFITDDFKRMEHDRFLGYGRPVMSLRDGEVVQVNRPVPAPSRLDYWTMNLRQLEDLETLRFLRGLLRDLGFGKRSGKDERAGLAPLEDVVAAIFEDLQRTSRENRSSLLLVYLPQPGDYRGSRSDGWRAFIGAEAEEHGYTFVDLVEEHRKLPPERVAELFRKGGHYTVEGNRWVAEALHERLGRTPRLSARSEGPNESRP